jgi:hypothetical protein
MYYTSKRQRSFCDQQPSKELKELNLFWAVCTTVDKQNLKEAVKWLDKQLSKELKGLNLPWAASTTTGKESNETAKR